MGIRGFMTFLQKHPLARESFEAYRVQGGCIVIDSKEIKCALYADDDVQKYGRSNYVEYRENIKKFFANLDKCGIKPIIITDNYKFDIDDCVKSRHEKISLMKKNVDGSFDKKKFVFPTFCGKVFDQTIKELKIFRVKSRSSDSFKEVIAAVANVMNAPVLANDTAFCGFSLQAGYIPLETFNWRKPKRGYINAKIFRISEFTSKFKVRQSDVHLLAILFQNRNSEEFFGFTDRELQKVTIPSHLATLDIGEFKRPNDIENCLMWFYNNRLNSSESIVEAILSNIAKKIDAEKIRERITGSLEKYQNPRVKGKILWDDCDDAFFSECREKLKVEIEQSGKNETEEDQNRVINVLQLHLPVDLENLMKSLEQGKQCVSPLSLVITDPHINADSPHVVASSIRKATYSLLVQSPLQSITIKEYDRVNLKYQEIEDVTVGISSEKFSILDVETFTNDKIMEQKRSFLLEVLIKNENHRDCFKSNITHFNDDLKLILAVTIYWIKEVKPSKKVLDAMIVLFTILQMKHSHEDSELASLLSFIRKRAKTDYLKPELLQKTGQWEACLRASFTLNDTLSYPFPSPSVGKMFSGCLFEKICSFTKSTRKEFEEILKGISEAEELKQQIQNILHKRNEM